MPLQCLGLFKVQTDADTSMMKAVVKKHKNKCI